MRWRRQARAVCPPVSSPPERAVIVEFWHCLSVSLSTANGPSPYLVIQACLRFREEISNCRVGRQVRMGKDDLENNLKHLFR
jgi:hypothetical protein